MLFRKGAIIWQRYWSLVINIFRDLCFRIGPFQDSVAYKNVAHKKASISVTFLKKNDGEKCPTARIKEEAVCQEAAAELGLSWGASWAGLSSPGGCVFANDGRSKVYFNNVLTADGINPKYAEICTGGHTKLTRFLFYTQHFYKQH